MKAPTAKAGHRVAPYAVTTTSPSRSQPRQKRNELAPTAPAWNTRVELKGGDEFPQLAFLEYQNIPDRFTDGSFRLPVKIPYALERDSNESGQLWDIAQGDNFGGNLTSFKDYQHLRDELEENFGGPMGCMDLINAAFDKYRQSINADQGDNKKWASSAASSQAEKEKSPDHDEKEALAWKSSIFADYLFFLFEYFVPRAPYAGKTAKCGGLAKAFGLRLGRDRTIEYLLSVCTGVVFGKKKVSSHWQQVCNKLATKKGDVVRVETTAEYLSIFNGYEGDFPGDDESFVDELAWMKRFCKERHAKGKKTKAEALDANCPLVLPPVLAVILQSIQDSSKIDWDIMDDKSYLFSQWAVPDGLHKRYLIEQQAFDKREKIAAAARKEKQQQTAFASSTTTGLGTIQKGSSSAQKSQGKKPVRQQGQKASLQPSSSSSSSSNIVPSPVASVSEVRSSSPSSNAGSHTREDLEVANILMGIFRASGPSDLINARRHEALDRLRRGWGMQ